MKGRFKLPYYLQKFTFNALPSLYFKKKYQRLKAFEEHSSSESIKNRLHYYFKITKPFDLPKEAVAVRDFKLRNNSSTYFFDLKEFLHYFTEDFKIAYQFGDDTHVNDYPTLFKARPIQSPNDHSILFKLNKKRHFRFIKDKHSFREKSNTLVWRGGAYHLLRRNFVQKYWNHPRCDIGQTNKKQEAVPWQTEYLSINDHLKHQFIACPEGNDVATNLKWVLSSNSLCLMPKPKFETWFMEGKLIAGVHYVEVKDDFSDMIDKMDFYHAHPEKAEIILKNAHNHVCQFLNNDVEDLLCLKVLESYAQFSGQNNVIKFS